MSAYEKAGKLLRKINEYDKGCWLNLNDTEGIHVGLDQEELSWTLDSMEDVVKLFEEILDRIENKPVTLEYFKYFGFNSLMEMPIVVSANHKEYKALNVYDENGEIHIQIEIPVEKKNEDWTEHISGLALDIQTWQERFLTAFHQIKEFESQDVDLNDAMNICDGWIKEEG